MLPSTSPPLTSSVHGTTGSLQEDCSKTRDFQGNPGTWGQCWVFTKPWGALLCSAHLAFWQLVHCKLQLCDFGNCCPRAPGSSAALQRTPRATLPSKGREGASPGDGAVAPQSWAGTPRCV